MKATSMRGVTIDFNRMLAQNPTMPALGNAGMNARGDLIARDGQIIKKREQIAQDYHRAGSATVKRVALNGIGSEVFASPAEAVAAVRAAQAVSDVPLADKSASKRKLNDD